MKPNILDIMRNKKIWIQDRNNKWENQVVGRNKLAKVSKEVATLFVPLAPQFWLIMGHQEKL